MTQGTSPGVYTIERDLSQYISDLSQTIAAMVGTAECGPVNIPTLVTSPKQYVDLFGPQNPKHYLGYAALAYLKKGNMLYVTRVAPSDAAKAKLTVPLPKSTPVSYAGEWTLVANDSTTATFTVTDYAGATATAKTIELGNSTVLPGFDFTDSVGTATANGKIGSDLRSFSTSALVSKYIKGSIFNITSGSGKDSNAVITNLEVLPSSVTKVTINSTKLNSYNSPTTTTAVGTVSAITGALPAAESTLFTIGKTNYKTANVGTIEVIYSLVGTTYATPEQKQALLDVLQGSSNPAKLVELEKLLTVTQVGSVTSIKISAPLWDTAVAGNATKNLTLIAAILTELITVFRTQTQASLPNATYPKLLATYIAARVVAPSTLVGLGSIAVDGSCAGIISAALNDTSTSINLTAIVPGASGSFIPESVATTVLTVTPLLITGTFTTNLYRPTWDIAPAGTNTLAPTYLKFTSNGDGDFSKYAITVSYNPTNLDQNQQIYTVRIYLRGSADTIATGSVITSDFTLLEQFDGTIEVLKARINENSNITKVKIDYTTSDVANLTTGGVVLGTISDRLTIVPTLTTDSSGNGYVLGTHYSDAIPAFSGLLLGGSVGTAVVAGDVIGDVGQLTGIYSFSDPDQQDINLILAPGWSADPAVSKALLQVCEMRSDCMAILDTPFALTPQGAINYRKNLLNANTSYGALYYPWIKIEDSISKRSIFIPPSGQVAAQYAYSDMVGEVHSAPAGRNRGVITEALVTERNLFQGDRDVLYANQINPIHFESGFGTYIRGQRTLQSASTALDRVNVRRLFLKLRKIIATASKFFEFEPGDSITAMRLKSIADQYMDEHQRKGAIQSYSINVGPEINTPYVLDNNELRMTISAVPTKTAEVITETFNILGQGKGITIS